MSCVLLYSPNVVNSCIGCILPAQICVLEKIYSFQCFIVELNLLYFKLFVVGVAI